MKINGHVRHARVALVSMPWVSTWMPSIQLAILRQCLETRALCDTYELYVDYAARISPRLYHSLSEAGGMTEEWVFAKDYFEQEGIPMPDGFLEQFPSFGLASREVERKVVMALPEVTADYLDDLVRTVQWGSYDVIAFSLSIYQTAASLALSRRIKVRYPHVKIVFGGNSCVGPAGQALLDISPYVNVVVQTEAELTFAALVDALVHGGDVSNISGVVCREASRQTTQKNLYIPHRITSRPNYDHFFSRFDLFNLPHRERIWIPFESSRGCWWGEKSQCTFCGLHEIMKYRARLADDVLAELDELHIRYGISRFFATDLIMPNEYYNDFLPKLVRYRRDYRFFYEIKPNLTWERVALLSHSGVKDVQPGLESLSTQVLKAMKKGQTACQVVQFLRWAAEFKIDPQWNIIVGTPGEDPCENSFAAKNARALFHLKPPRLIHFELDRFSPIFNTPENYGLSNLRPLSIYKYIFPVPDATLSNLVYRFEYDDEAWNGLPPWLSGNGDGLNYPAEYNNVIQEWHSAAARSSYFTATRRHNGLVLEDARFSIDARIIMMEPHEADLYEFLDTSRPRSSVCNAFKSGHEAAFQAFGGPEQVEKTLDDWHDSKLVFQEDGRIVALAVWSPAREVPIDMLSRNAFEPIHDKLIVLK